MSASSLFGEAPSKCCVTYEQPLIVRGLQRLHRLGFATTFDYTQPISEQKSYVWGLVIIPILCGIFFSVWTIVCIVLTCLGPDRVGFWSGKSLVIPPPDTTDPKGCCKSPIYRPRRLRIAFLTAALLQFASILVLVLLGFRNFDKTVASSYEASNYVEDALSPILDVLQQAIIAQASLSATTGSALRDSLNTCANNLGFSNISSSSLHFYETYAQQIAQTFTTFYDTLDSVNNANDNMQSLLVTIQQKYLYSLILWIPLICFLIFLVSYLVLVWSGRSNRKLDFMKTYVVLPLFCVWVTLSWIISLVFFAAALANSDACSGTGPNDIFQQSPAGSIANVVDSTLHNLTDKRILVQVAEYYLGCENPFPPIILVEMQRAKSLADNFTSSLGIQPLQGQALDRLLGILSNVTESVRTRESFIQLAANSSMLENIVSKVSPVLSGLSDAVLQQVDKLCTSAGAQGFINLLVSIEMVLVVVARSLPVGFRLLQCKTAISPAYDLGINSAACQHAPAGFGWIMVGLVFISIFGLSMITVRSALLPVEVQQKDALNDGGVEQEVVATAVPVVEDGDAPMEATFVEQGKSENIASNIDVSVKETFHEQESVDDAIVPPLVNNDTMPEETAQSTTDVNQ